MSPIRIHLLLLLAATGCPKDDKPKAASTARSAATGAAPAAPSTQAAAAAPAAKAPLAPGRALSDGGTDPKILLADAKAQEARIEGYLGRVPATSQGAASAEAAALAFFRAGASADQTALATVVLSTSDIAALFVPAERASAKKGVARALHDAPLHARGAQGVPAFSAGKSLTTDTTIFTRAGVPYVSKAMLTFVTPEGERKVVFNSIVQVPGGGWKVAGVQPPSRAGR